MNKKNDKSKFLENFPEDKREDAWRDAIKFDFEWFVPQWIEEIDELEIYLRSLEEFIDNEEKSEVESLNPTAKRLKDESKSVFWSWNYPVHWNNIFRSRLRASYIIMLISFMERCLDLTCRIIADVIEPPLGVRDIKGDMINRNRLFIEGFGRFSRPTSEQWELMSTIYGIRCVIVHQNLDLWGSRWEKAVKNLANVAPGLKIAGDLTLEKSFCEYCIGFVRELCTSLQKELETTLISHRIL